MVWLFRTPLKMRVNNPDMLVSEATNQIEQFILEICYFVAQTKAEFEPDVQV